MIHPIHDDGEAPASLPAASSETARNAAVWRYLPLAAIALALVAVWFSGLTHYLNLEYLLNSREDLARLIAANLPLALLIYAAIYVVSVALSVPGALALTIAGGFLFGGWLNGAITVVAATAGATLVFLAARTSLGETLAKRAGPWMARLRDGFAEDAVSYMLFLRLTPVFPFWLVNLAPALLGVRLGTFVWTTFVGALPGTFAYSLAGAGLDSVAAAQKQAYDNCIAAGREGCTLTISPQQLVTRELILAFAAIGVVALIPVLVKRLRAGGRKAAPTDGRPGASHSGNK
ncbi:MAG: TVP38/TMEM64 family protein [Hyphomicrobiales bacterium]|nr:TVP38/TMEM64 family protein [Hyphomicrobiales bacterium]